MRGILGHGAYLPYRRLDRSGIAPVAGAGGGAGTRTVAGFDEDTTTLAVEASRLVLRAAPPAAMPRSLLFSTVTPAYVDKTNATAIHAALRLPPDVAALDLNGALRSSVGALRLALDGVGPTLVVSADLRTGLPGSADEANGGDAGAALLVGDGASGGAPVLAERIGAGTATEEFVERWRTPGDVRSKQWEDKFGELKYVPLGLAAWRDALTAAGLAGGTDERAGDDTAIDRVAIVSTHARAARSLARRLRVGPDALVDDLSGTVGMSGAAHPALVLSSMLERAEPGEVMALVTLADGADVFVFRATDAVGGFVPARPVAAQVAGGGPVDYGTFLRWRGMLPAEPPRRPEPARVSVPAAARGEGWKFGLLTEDGSSLADATGTVATFTVDRLAWSPSPPVVFAVVDLDGDGGRLPVELTDVDAADVDIGSRVEMTFRRLSSADGIHNYFWKARPARV